jgi:hypothetical protein
MVPALPRNPRRQWIHCSLTLVFLTSVPLATGAGDSELAPPQGMASERYAPIWERSPFALKVVIEPGGPTHSFAENFALAGLSDVEGQITVYLKDKVSGEYLKLINQTASDSGIAFDKIVENPDPKLVKVSLRKGTETAEVGYSQEPTGGVAGQAGGPGPAAAGALGKRPAAVPPGPTPTGGPPGGDPNAQQKSRRRIILPQAGAPQTSITPSPALRGFLLSRVSLAPSSVVAAQVSLIPLIR